MQHQVILVVYGVLICLGLIPVGILGVSVYLGPVIVLRATREGLLEGERREEEQYTHEQGAKQRLLQPAYKMYVAGRGWYVVGYVVRSLFAHVHARSSKWIEEAAVARYVASKNVLFMIPAWLGVIGLHVAARLLYLSALISALLFLPLYSIVLFCWGICVQVGLTAFSLFYFINTRAIPLRCPHCYKEMPVPTYLCPSCEAEHSRLWPSNYGIMSHRCIRCQTSLPTLDLLGRQRLARVCPFCRHGLPPRIADGAGVHIALVGATSAGKTSYLMMALREWRRLYTREEMYFIDATQTQRIEDALQRFKRGQTLSPTKETTPQAYTLKIQKRGREPSRLLYLYDPAGEAFAGDAQASKQTYYKYSDGIIFVIDPLSLVDPLESAGKGSRESAGKGGRKGGDPTEGGSQEWQSQDRQQMSTLTVMRTYERMMMILELYAGMSKRKRYSQPIAVVVSKIDQLQFNNEIGVPAARVRMRYDPAIRSEAEALSSLVRTFLCERGLENLVRDLELYFEHVRYFSCSALGRTPTTQETRALEPERVLEPLQWILEQRRVL